MSKLRSTLELGTARFLSIAINLISVPLYLKWIGETQFGAIVFLQIIGVYCVTIGDPGLASGVQQHLVKLQHEGDTEGTHKVLNSHRVVNFWAGALVTGLYAVLCFVLHMEQMPFDLNRVVFFLCSGLSIACTLYSLASVSMLMAIKNFRAIAVANVVGSIFTLVLALILVYTMRHVAGFAIGTLVGQLVTLLVLIMTTKRLGYGDFRWSYDKEAFRPCAEFAKHNVWNNIGSALGSIDRTIVKSVAGQVPLAAFGIAQRIPQTIKESVPFVQIYQPEFAKAFLRGPKEYENEYVRNSIATLAIAFTLLIIPSALGESVLRVWLRDEFQPLYPALLVASCLGAAFSLNGYTFAVAAYGASQPKLVIPFVWFLGLGILFLTGPAMVQFGLLGVLWLRVILEVVQLGAIEWVVWKRLIPAMSMRRQLVRKLAIIALGCLFWVAGWWMSRTQVVQQFPWAGVGVIPVLCLGFLLACTKSKAVELPEKVRAKYPFLA